MQVRHTLLARYQVETTPVDFDNGHVWAVATDTVTAEQVRLYSCPAIGESAATSLADAHQRLDHAHIDRCTDFVFDDDAVYAVFRGTDASPVSTLLSPSTVASVRDATLMTLRVAQALRYASDKGFAHPHLSADTITVKALNQPESVKVIGLQLQPRDLGSPNYVSGLGGLLFQLLTGAKVAGPFGSYRRASAQRTDVPEALDRIVERSIGLSGTPFEGVDGLIDVLKQLSRDLALEPPKRAARRWTWPSRSSDTSVGEFLVLPLAVVLLFAVGWIITQDGADQAPPAQDRQLLVDRARVGAGPSDEVQTSTLTIESEPTGQRLWRDGAVIGVTPMILRVSDGRHRLQVGPDEPSAHHGRFRRQRIRVAVDPVTGTTADVSVDLMPQVNSVQIYALQRAQ